MCPSPQLHAPPLALAKVGLGSFEHSDSIPTSVFPSTPLHFVASKLSPSRGSAWKSKGLNTPDDNPPQEGKGNPVSHPLHGLFQKLLEASQRSFASIRDFDTIPFAGFSSFLPYSSYFLTSVIQIISQIHHLLLKALSNCRIILLKTPTVYQALLR